MPGYPFFRYVAALLAGIVLAEKTPLPALWPFTAGAVCLVFFVGSLLKTARNPVRPLSVVQGICLPVVLLAVGYGLVWGRLPVHDPTHLLNQPTLPTAYEAVVSALPEARASTYKVELTLRRGQLADSTAPFRPLTGRILVYLDKTDSAVAAPVYGDVWLVVGAPRPVDPPLNPGEFDYRAFLAHRGIFHQQYLRTWQRRIVGHQPPSQVLALAYRVNRWAEQVLTSRVGTKAEYGIVNAMLLGSRDDLEPAQYQTYAAAGAIHILSVSGMHVGILFVVMNWLLARLAPGRAGSWWVVGVKLGALWFFALMTGLPVAVLRSALMFSFLLLAEGLGRTQSLLNTLAASAFLLLCYDPFAAFSISFQLSYLAVGGIAVAVPYLRQLVRPRHWILVKLWDISVVAFAAQLFTFPLALYYFHTFPTYFLLANPVVMVLSAALIPLAVATLVCSLVPGLGAALGWLLQQTAWLLNAMVAGVGRLPGAVLTNIWLSETGLFLTFALLLLGYALAITPRRTYLAGFTALAVALAVVLVFERNRQNRQYRLAVHFLPRKTAISLTSGHQSLVLTDDDWKQNPRNFDFYLKNALGGWGIDSLTVHNFRTDSVLTTPALARFPDLVMTVWRGRSLLLVNRLPAYRPWYVPRVVDYAVVRRNAATNWPALTRRVVARHVILDDSNRPETLDSLLAQPPPPGTVVHALRRDGVFVAEWE